MIQIQCRVIILISNEIGSSGGIHTVLWLAAGALLAGIELHLSAPHAITLGQIWLLGHCLQGQLLVAL